MVVGTQNNLQEFTIFWSSARRMPNNSALPQRFEKLQRELLEISACRRQVSYCMRSNPALIFATIALCLVPGNAQILCPFLKAPSELFGVEDIPMNVQGVWNRTVGISGEKPAFRMYNLDSLDCDYVDREEITEEKLNYNAPPNSIDSIVLQVSVRTGRIWLDRGYHTCRDASGTVVNDANFTESITEMKSFQVEGLFHEVNCMLQYVVFQTLVNGNSDYHIANQGREPIVDIWVGPPCMQGPVGCGADFIKTSQVTTVMHMATVNDLPRLESCPTSRLSNGAGPLSWNTADGDETCQAASTFVGGPLIRNPPRAGGLAPPTRVTPPFCQRQDTTTEQPPHCNIFGNVPTCLSNASSFVYHIEDEDDASLEIQGLRVKDPDLWDGHLTMKWTLRFRPGQSAADRGYNDPVPSMTIQLESFYEIETELGPMNDYCARPKYSVSKRARQLVGDKYCSQTRADSLGGVFVPKDNRGQDSYEQLQVRVRTLVSRQPEEGECRFVLDGTPRHPICTEVRNADNELVDCQCTSRVYERLSTADGTLWKSIFFYDIIERDTFEVFETGYFIMTYSDTQVTKGQMFADRGVRSWADGAERVDLFMASPFTINGTVDTTGGDRVIMELLLETDTTRNPKFAVSLSSNYGSVTMPNSNVQLQTDTPNLKTFRGTIDQVNEAIYRLVYRLPSASMPNLHTMASHHWLYGEVRETITLSIDDQGYDGQPNGLVAGTATVVEYDVVIIADNDAPVVENPTESYMVPENTWVALPGFTISDVDAKDVLINERNKTTMELKLTLECDHGALKVGQADAANLLFAEPIPARCTTACGSAPITSLERHMALPENCRSCLQREGELLMNTNNGVGAQKLVVFGSVEDLASSLQNLQYRAEAGFNSEVPQAGNPFGEDGCPREYTPGLSREFVRVTVDDIGNVGCRSRESKTAVLERTIAVTPAEDPPRITFDVNRVERCPRCIDCTCPAFCGGGTCSIPIEQTTEDSVLRFSATRSVAIRDFDTTEVSFGTVQYELMVNSSFGALVLTNAPDVTLLAGFESCISVAGDCPTVRMRGSLCEINKALQRIEYRPGKDYNSEFGDPDRLFFAVQQIGMTHPESLIAIDVIVLARNDKPVVNLWQSGPPQIRVRTPYIDMYVIKDADAAPPQCASTITCIHLSDPDACEAKYLYFGIKATPADIIAAQRGTSPVCALNMSDPVGLVTLRVTSRMGSVWFFPANGTDMLGADGMINLGGYDPTEIDAGKRSQNLTLMHPLSWFVGGVLRYYASEHFARPDDMVFEMEDNGNTGAGTDTGFCCCADRECSSCSSGECRMVLDVTTCRDVRGFQCKDSVKSVNTLKGWEISLIAAACFVTLLGGISLIVYLGARDNQMQLVHPNEEDDDEEHGAVGGKLANGKGADKHLMVEEGRTENVLAI